MPKPLLLSAFCYKLRIAVYCLLVVHGSRNFLLFMSTVHDGSPFVLTPFAEEVRVSWIQVGKEARAIMFAMATPVITAVGIEAVLEVRTTDIAMPYKYMLLNNNLVLVQSVRSNCPQKMQRAKRSLH